MEFLGSLYARTSKSRMHVTMVLSIMESTKYQWYSFIFSNPPSFLSSILLVSFLPSLLHFFLPIFLSPIIYFSSYFIICFKYLQSLWTTSISTVLYCIELHCIVLYCIIRLRQWSWTCARWRGHGWRTHQLSWRYEDIIRWDRGFHDSVMSFSLLPFNV